MRSAWILALALLAVGLAPPAAHAGGDKAFLTDATGDTQATLFGAGDGPAAIPNPLGPDSASADLTSLQVEETDTSFLFGLSVAGVTDPLAFEWYQVHFDWRNVSYDAQIQWQNLATGTSLDGWLTAVANDDKDGEEYYQSYGGGSYVAALPVKLDASKATFSFEIPKAYILDGLKRMPNKGDNLTNVHVDSMDSITLIGGAQIVDRMPDADGVKLPVTIGDEQKGHLALSSPDRVRVSNGGASTFVYSVTLTNTGDAEDNVDLAMTDLPPGWNGTVQTPVKLPGHAVKTLTVLASVPFGHVHGGFSAFNLTATSQDDPGSMAKLRLGILHTPIPQPAGHHNELYLHPVTQSSSLFEKVAPYTTAVMNTEASKGDEATREISLGGTNDGNGWWIPLNPGLAMGLDFDLAKTGTVVGNIAAHDTAGSATLSAKLYLAPTGNAGNNAKMLLLATSKPQDLAFSPNGAAPFSLQLTPTEASDYIPYAQHQNLVLALTLDRELNFNIISSASPALQVSGFKMTLPLNEYADRLTGISEAASAIELKADGPVEKLARPGTLMTYTFTLRNTGFTADTFVVEAAGNDAKLGSIIPGDEIDLAPKETKQVTLGVRVPGELKDGQSVEVILFAHAKSDPSKMALQRTKTTVATTGNATKDESRVFLNAQNDAKKSPGFEGAFVVGAAAVAVGLLAMRRRSR